MKVLTITSAKFPVICGSLADKIIQSKFHPDIIIGIRNGGGYVGMELAKSFREAKYTEVEIRRKGSNNKNNKYVRRFIAWLPLRLNNWLRIAESQLLKKKKHIRLGNISFDKHISNLLLAKGQNILLVDDAIDSGATIAKLVGYINANYPDNNIKVAVITVTTASPIIDADFYLYHDNTLIRFPWAIDAQKQGKPLS